MKPCKFTEQFAEYYPGENLGKCQPDHYDMIAGSCLMEKNLYKCKLCFVWNGRAGVRVKLYFIWYGPPPYRK